MREKSCGAIVINDDKVLLIKSTEGIFGFPKGHMEVNENEIDTAIREVKEETNVDIIIDKDKRYTLSYLVKNNITKDVVYFIAHPANLHNLVAQEGEIMEVFWANIEEVENILEFKNIKELWKNVKKDIIFENNMI